jgi:hypothetical protein
METVTEHALRELVVGKGEQCVSIYMPTHPVGREGMQDMPRLKNLVVAAETQLIERGMRRVAARELLQPLLALPQDDDWSSRSGGLAVFRSDELFVTYRSAIAFEEGVNVGSRFHVKQLLPAISEPFGFFVLVLSRNKVRLLQATSNGFKRLQPPGLPSCMERALNLQGADRGEQVHSGMRGDLGKEAAVFHGQGGHRDTIKDELIEYLRVIDNSIRPLLRAQAWPLILAGVEYELAMFRELSEYDHVADEQLHGAFDYVDDRAVYELAMPLARASADTKRRRAIAKYKRLTDTIQATDEIDEIMPAAYDSRIECLLVDVRCELCGHYDPATRLLDLETEVDSAADLVEDAVTQTISHGGNVYAVRDEFPTKKALRAVIRFW